MGMYNEVYADCDCGGKAEAQIPQIELGFGGYDISNHKTYEHLSYDDQVLLANYVIEELQSHGFYCSKCKTHIGMKQLGVS